MMHGPLQRLNEVYHVGLLDPSTRTGRASLEAFLLSVSIHPEEWASIARCGGPTWTLERPGACYLDATALDDTAEAEITAWGLERGYLVPATIWRVWHYDDEGDSWGYMSFTDEAQARMEADCLDYEDEEIPSENGETLDPIEGMILTEAAMAALERWPEATMAQDGITILWAREVLALENPDLVGVWWNDDKNPEALSCPRGGIFPERLAEFRIYDEHGCAPPALFVGPGGADDDPSP